MSPVSPVLHTVQTVRIALKFIRNAKAKRNTPNPPSYILIPFILL